MVKIKIIIQGIVLISLFGYLGYWIIKGFNKLDGIGILAALIILVIIIFIIGLIIYTLFKKYDE